MHIELLYFDGCPNWQATLADLRRVLQAMGQPSDVTLTLVSTMADAQRARFAGSPTVRVNGRDVEPDAPQHEDYRLDCRLYWVNGQPLGKPPVAWLERAVHDAARGTSNDR
jgi:hypothetical protein